MQNNPNPNILTRYRIQLISIATGMLFAVVILNVWTTIKDRFDESISNQVELTAERISNIITSYRGLGLSMADLTAIFDDELESYADLYIEIRNSNDQKFYQSGEFAGSLDDHQSILELNSDSDDLNNWRLIVRTTPAFFNNTNYGFIYVGLFIAMVMSFLLGVTVYYAQIARRNSRNLRETNAKLTEAWEKAEQASLSKTKFLANMSHEIRTPMNVVLGFISVLKSEEITQKHREYLNLMEVSSKNLLSIVNDILEIEKLESGEILLTEIRFNPLAELHKLMKMQEVFFDEKGLYIKSEFKGDAKIWVLGDLNKFHQIFNNLIRNAFKFTDRGGLTIRVMVVDEQDYVNYEILVSDTGIGIPEEKRSEIFERFNQIDAQPNRKYEGTGLGLAITQKLVEALGGTIAVESNVGVGTTFEVNFRFKKLDVPEDSNIEDGLTSAESPQIQFPNSRILVVDDNYVNILVIQKTLEYYGIKSDYAESASGGIELAAKHPYNLILMDLHMPDIDGYEAANLIKEQGIDVPIVALTADVTTDAKRKAFEHGMPDYLTKPFSRDKLLIILKKYLLQEV
ncbi:MAG: response regulator [Balneolaceae bacterium]|nr:response regulator [Balneolaceae bacterium]